MDPLLPVRIACDYRERRGALYRVLMDRDDVAVEVANLPVGDFVVEGRITVERKTWGDFLLSLQTGRLFRQAAALKREGERPVLLVEGLGYPYAAAPLSPVLRGALTSLSVMWYLPVLWAADASEAADLLTNIGRQWTRDRRETWTPPPRPSRSSAPRIRLLRCLPGVGPRLARRLLDRFGSIRAICNAGLDELKAVPGIGSQRAAAIHALLGDGNLHASRTRDTSAAPSSCRARSS